MQTLRNRAFTAEQQLREMAWTSSMLNSLYEACGDLESAVETMEKSVENGVRGDECYDDEA